MKKLLNLLLLVALLAFSSGCGTLSETGTYGSGQLLTPAGLVPSPAAKTDSEILYDADLAITTGYDLLHTFVIWEFENREALAPFPAIKKAADDVRVHAKQWVGSAVLIRDAFAANPTPENRNALQTSLGVLRTAIGQASLYMAAPHQKSN